jgi:4-amino-4-deoxy-L-arabinose transferase-like glycosyltransferase
MKKIVSFDTMLLFVLTTARVRIDTMAALATPDRQADLAKVPFLSALLPDKSLELLQDWLVAPYSLLLIASAFAVLVIYVILDVLRDRFNEVRVQRAKLALVWLIIILTVVAQSLLLVFLRQATGPASYTHDGGVIQTEEALKYVLAGKNPYVEDYVNTPMAEWGLDYKTALYHYPYLPWTFLFSAPFYLVSQAVLGWYDQRFVYLLLFVITLLLAPRLAQRRADKLGLVMVLGLNPIMGVDVIFGQNDSFVLFWIVLALWLLLPSREKRGDRKWGVVLSVISFGLACASKPTAWFLAPFYFLYLLRGEDISVGNLRALVIPLLRRAIPFFVIFAVLVLPFAVWDWGALADDVWGWASGVAEVPYQIRGWGFANFILGLGLVESKLDYFPFWVPELFICLPLLLFLLWKQVKTNILGAMLYGYSALMFVFFYFSRFLNENYLGFILAFVALAYCADEGEGRWGAPFG